MNLVRTRWAAIGAAVAITLGGGGIGLVSATTPSDALTLVSITPCRVSDTRPAPNTVGAKTSPLGTGEVHTIEAHGDNGNCTDIPTSAKALSLNVTAIGATLPTFLTVWAAGETRPDSSSLNPAPGAPPTPNAVTTGLNSEGEFSVYNFQGNVNLAIDINGYYVDHHHDDRYYTKTQTDAKLAEVASEHVKHIQINVFGESDTNFPSTKYDNLNDVGVQSQDVDFSFSLPPDYTAGTDLELRVTAYARPQDAPCSAELNYNWGTAFRAGEASTNFGFRNSDGNEAQFGITKAMQTGRIAEVWEFTIVGDNLQPLDAAGFGLFWQVCIPIIAGVILTYE